MATASSSIAVIVAAGDRPALERIAGRTLLARAVATAHAATRVDRVAVVAEAAPVLQAAEAENADLAAAPGLAADGEAALMKALSLLAGDAAIAVFVDPAAALITPADIDRTIDAVLGDADCAVAVVPARQAYRQAAAGALEPLVGEPGGALLVDAGALRAVRLDAWRTAGTRLFGRLATVPLPAERALSADAPGSRAAIAAILGATAAARGAERLPVRPAGLVMDFDGVFTDNRVLVDQDGREAVLCNRSDGMGLEDLRARGLPMLVLSKEKNPVVAARCGKLKLDCLQAVQDKGPALLAWCDERGLDPEHVVYIGNDTNDLVCFALVGCAVAVADAHPAALAAADVVLSRNGGAGALRELTDLLTERLESAA